MLRQHASSNSLNSGSSSGTAGMQPRELLCCISGLASLKYSMPVQLAELLEQGPAGGRAGLSGLRLQQLASLITNLAKAGVRPSNAWLVALMQVGEMVGERLLDFGALHLGAVFVWNVLGICSFSGSMGNECLLGADEYWKNGIIQEQDRRLNVPI